MDNNKWHTDRITKLLDNMPDIKDSRSKEDILARLHQDERLGTTGNNKTTGMKMKKWIPVFVTIAALLILTLLLPSMLNGGNGKMDQGASEMSVANDVDYDATESESSKAAQESEGDEQSEVESREVTNAVSDITDGITRYAVYPADVGDDTIFHMGLVGETAASVPVTFLIPSRQIKEDFGELQPTSFDLYEMYAGRIDEEALGFDDYHPYSGQLTVEGKTLIQTLPVGHGYDRSSAAMEVHRNTLIDTFYGFDTIQFENEDGTPVEFDQVGEPSKPMQLFGGTNLFNYYISKFADGREYISSNFSRTYENIDSALQEMKNNPNDIFSSVIPKNIEFEVTEEKGLTSVKFVEPLDLNEMNVDKANQMIDGILLTGASFGKRIQFENVVQSEWNDFDFNGPLPIPVGSNLVPFLLK